jgi:hypothetical protein
MCATDLDLELEFIEGEQALNPGPQPAGGQPPGGQPPGGQPSGGQAPGVAWGRADPRPVR